VYASVWDARRGDDPAAVQAIPDHEGPDHPAVDGRMSRETPWAATPDRSRGQAITATVSNTRDASTGSPRTSESNIASSLRSHLVNNFHAAC